MQTLREGTAEWTADLPRRVAEALSLLSLVESLPDTGMHGERCTHRDCLALRLRKILRGEE